MHQEYLDAGADIIVTNTFGGTSESSHTTALKDSWREINAAGRGDCPPGRRRQGLCRRLHRPHRQASWSRWETSPSTRRPTIFREQAQALIDAGCDLITLETFLDIKEIRAGIIAIREISADIPIIAMLTFDDKGRSVLGTPPEAAAITLEAVGRRHRRFQLRPGRRRHL